MSGHPDSTAAIESRIFVLGSHRLMLDADLARLYGVKVKALKQAVRRNVERFPADFMLNSNGKRSNL